MLIFVIFRFSMMEVALTFELANVITQKETDPLPSGLKKGEHEGNTENLVTEIQCLHDHNFFRISQSQSQTEVVNAGADTLDTGETAKADCSSVSSGISQTYLMEPPASLTGAEIVADKNEFDVFDHVGLVVDVSTEEEISRDNDSTSVATSFTSRSGTPSGSVPSGKRKYNIFAEGIGATLDLLVKKFRPGETVSRSLTPDPEDIEETTVADYQPCVSTQEPRPSWATTKSGGGSGGGGASTGHHQSTTKITSVSHSSGNFSFQRGAGGEEMRQLMRKKMFRCTICKNRFIERDLFERHMKERHPKKYEVYMEEKNKREEKERLEYLEFLRIQREREERRNQRLAEIYEERLKLEAEGHNVGPPPLPEDIFPPRPPRPKSPDEDVGVEVNSNGPPEDDGGGTVRFV